MLIDRSHLSWGLFSGISLIAGTVLYVSYAIHSPAGPSGGSAIGLLFGVLGTLMMLFAGLLAARKSVRVRRLGSAQFWLKGHLWLGTLCIPFILFHAGFEWGGVLEQLLWYTLAIVAGSGFFGLAVQQFLPRLLWNQTPLETFEAQTPYQCDRMTFISDVQISMLSGVPLDVPPDHLRAPVAKLVRDYYQIVNGPGARGELNAKKLQLLQQVSPPAVRDFFWAMAKYAKSEAKAIRSEGDFPELLAATYAGLKPQSSPPAKTDSHNDHASGKTPAATTKLAAASESDTQKSKAPVMNSVAMTIPKKDLEGLPIDTTQPSTEKAKLSPIEQMRLKTAQKAAVENAAGNDAPADGEKKRSAEQPASPAQPDPSAAPAAKLSPIEQMRLKAAQKAAAAETAASQTTGAEDKKADAEQPALPAQADASTAPAAKLSPIEQMRLKAAQKAAAAETAASQTTGAEDKKADVDQPTPPAPADPSAAPVAKLSPIEQMRLKAAQKAAAAETAASQTTEAEDKKADVDQPTPPAQAEPSTVLVAKLSPIEQMRLKAAQKAAAAETAASQTTAAEDKNAGVKQPAPPAQADPSAAPVAKLSPIEQMRRKAAQKAAAENSATPASPPDSNTKVTAEQPDAPAQIDASAPPVANLSPLEMMKKKAAEKAAEKAAQADPQKAGLESPVSAEGAPKSPLDMLKKNAGAPAETSATKPVITPKPAVVRDPGQKPPTASPALAPVNSAPAPTASEKQILRGVYVETIRPFLAEFRTRRSVASSPLASNEAARRLFCEKESTLPTGLHPLLQELNQRCEIRRQIERQRRVLRWMHWWLMIHVPASMVLIVFLVAHVIMALRVIPI